MGRTERAIQAQWYSTKFMNAQNENIFMRQIKQKGETTCQDKARQDILCHGASNLNISEEG